MRYTEKTREYYFRIIGELSIYGKSFLCGSARKYKEFLRNHDVDIGVLTDFKSEEFLIEACSALLEKHKTLGMNTLLPFHFLLIGNFKFRLQYVQIGNKKHLIQFIPRKYRYLIWLSIKLKKWKKSLLKKS